MPISIPTNILAGEFLANFCIYNTEGLISNVVTTSINVLRLGTGSLQISLSWNNTTDQDLHITDPSGESIPYLNEFSASEGQLDRDDVDGFGSENIF